MSVDLTKYVKPNTVCVYRESLSKHFIIEKIAEIASASSENSESLKHFIAGSLQAREMLGPTALTRGLALPHCRVEGIKDFVLGILVSPEGVAYGSLDGKLTRVFFFIIAPKESVEEHLSIMSEIGAFFNSEENIISLAECKDNKTLYQRFLKLWEEYTGKTH